MNQVKGLNCIFRTARTYLIPRRKLVTTNCRPQEPRTTVTVLGSIKHHGEILALLLKQNTLIDEVRLYSENEGACHAAVDISSIDTSPRVRAYTGGPTALKGAIEDSTVIIICGGDSAKIGQGPDSLFEQNVDPVRHFAIHIAEFNPKAIVCVSSPPVHALVPMISEEFKKAEVYDHRKIIGLTNLASIRANAFAAPHISSDPCKVLCPTVGGFCSRSTIAVLSQITPKGSITHDMAKKLQNLIANAELNLLQKKFSDNSGSCYLTAAFATNRFIYSLLKALKGDPNRVECAFVRQKNHIGEFLPYMTSLVRLGRGGIEATYMPRLNAYETELLEHAYKIILRYINMGRGYITGIEVRDSRLDVPPRADQIIKKPVTDYVGDVRIDFDPKMYQSIKIIQ